MRAIAKTGNQYDIIFVIKYGEIFFNADGAWRGMQGVAGRALPLVP